MGFWSRERTCPKRRPRSCPVLNDRRRVDWLNGAGPLWEGYHESRRCSRDTYPAPYTTRCTSITKNKALFITENCFDRKNVVACNQPPSNLRYPYTNYLRIRITVSRRGSVLRGSHRGAWMSGGASSRDGRGRNRKAARTFNSLRGGMREARKPQYVLEGLKGQGFVQRWGSCGRLGDPGVSCTTAPGCAPRRVDARRRVEQGRARPDEDNGKRRVCIPTVSG